MNSLATHLPLLTLPVGDPGSMRVEVVAGSTLGPAFALLCAVLLLAAMSMGAAALLRSLPGTTKAQAWLEGTWTHGKPLTCWFCLVGWFSLLALLAGWALHVPECPATFAEGAAVWLGSVGVGGLLLRAMVPILPASGMPPSIFLDNSEPSQDDAREVQDRLDGEAAP